MLCRVRKYLQKGDLGAAKYIMTQARKLIDALLLVPVREARKASFQFAVILGDELVMFHKVNGKFVESTRNI